MLLAANSLNKDEQSVVNAARGLRLANFVTPDHNAVLEGRLHGISLSVGLREPISDIEMSAIVNFIKSQFGEFTMEELSLAFELAMARKLNTEASAFNSFSCEYVGRVLSAFREFRREANRKKIKCDAAQKSIAMLSDEDLRTREEKNQDSFNAITTYIEENKSMPIIWAWDSIYEHIVASGIKSFMEGEKKRVRARIEAEYKIEISNAKANGDRQKHKDLTEKLNNQENIKYECRRLVAIEFCKTFFKASLAQ